MMDDTDWILWDFTPPKTLAKTEKKRPDTTKCVMPIKTPNKLAGKTPAKTAEKTKPVSTKNNNRG